MSDFPPAPPPGPANQNPWGNSSPPSWGNTVPSAPPGPPQGYQHYGMPMGGPSRSSGKATASLVLGILSIVVCWLGLILGIVAIALGVSARKEISQSNGTVGGGGLATAGLVTGIVGTVIWGGWILLAIVANVASSV